MHNLTFQNNNNASTELFNFLTRIEQVSQKHLSNQSDVTEKSKKIEKHFEKIEKVRENEKILSHTFSLPPNFCILSVTSPLDPTVSILFIQQVYFFIISIIPANLVE